MTTPYRMDMRSFGQELQVTITGEERSFENVVACWLQIAGEVKARGATRLLAVSHVKGEPMQAERMTGFFADMEGLGLEGVRVAYVDTAGFKTPLMETAEILAGEHGFSARIFDNLIAAELWLRHGDRP